VEKKTPAKPKLKPMISKACSFCPLKKVTSRVVTITLTPETIPTTGPP